MYNTGNPIPSAALEDMADNAQVFDNFVNSSSTTTPNRNGASIKTRAGFESDFDAQILNMGFTRVGTFATGATITNPRQTLLWDIADGGDGQEYGWSGPFQKVVPAASTPASTGGISVGAWISRFDPELRTQLAQVRTQLAQVDSPVLLGGQPASVLHATYIITGSVNLANPYWGAPTTDTDCPSAAHANLLAIQKMLNSGAKRCELDDKPRYFNNTLIMDTRGQTFMGQGNDGGALIFYGGNIPIISRANPADPNAAGKSGMRVEHMRIADRSDSRSSAWSINLTNGDSNGVDHIFLDGIAGLGHTANYGVALGAAVGGAYAGNSFICHIKNSRLSAAKCIINTSDSYVETNELWGNSRDFALMLGSGGTGVINNQIVPGTHAGIYIKSGFLVEILRIVGNYFDGCYVDIFTGVGIRSDAPSGILNSTLEANTFWNLNDSGVYLSTFNNSRLVNNIFKDCASADTAKTPDIYIISMSGSKIDNTHTRSIVAPKSGGNRVNLSPAVQVTANTSGAINEVAQSVATPATYIDSQIGNPSYVIDNGRILNRSIDQNIVNGTVQIKYGIAYIAVNGLWKPITT